MSGIIKKTLAVFVSFLMIMTFLAPSVLAEGDDPQATVKPDKGSLKASLSDAEKKLDSQLLHLIRPEMSTEQAAGFVSNYFTGNSGLSYTSESAPDAVDVYVKMESGASFGALKGVVKKVTDTDPKHHVAVAKVSVDQLEALAGLPGVKSVHMVVPPVVNAGSEMSEGDSLLKADQLRSQMGADGTGVIVGVISNGANHYEDSIASGDLPSDVHILSDEVGGDEGTAMMEIVHDLAPGAQLYFHDCGTNEIEFNEAIDDLIGEGCTVISDDISWPTEPFFEDGSVASHVSGVVEEDGIVYVTSAGNEADAHFQGPFVEDGTTGCSNFNRFPWPADRKDLYVDLKTGGSATVVLQWNDPFGASDNDYDLYLGSPDHSKVYASSTEGQTGDGDPLEWLAVSNLGPETECAIWVEGFNDPAVRNLEIYVFPRNSKAVMEPFNVVGDDSIFGQAASPEALTCAAIDANPNDFSMNIDNIEWFSSRGPVTMLSGSPRQKPDISGADGVSVTGAGGFPSTFYGTSAASPHIAAIAALLWSLYPDLGSQEIRSLITGHAVDKGDAGFDNEYGYGKANALASAQAVVRYTVTFDSRGGSAVDPVKVIRGKKIAEPDPAPTRDGYGFRGWYKESGYVHKWDFDSDTVTANITLYAKWQGGPYTVTFDSQGGGDVDPVTAYFGDKVAEPDPAPTKTDMPSWGGTRIPGMPTAGILIRIP